MATPYQDAANCFDWTNTDQYKDAAAAAELRMHEDGIDALYYVCPSIDGRPFGKMVTRELFSQFAKKGVRIHPLAFTDFRETLWGEGIYFPQEGQECLMIADWTTFRQLPWSPKFARVLCYYYDPSTGDMLGIDPRSTLAKREHDFREQTGVTLLAGIEPEMMWLKRTSEGDLEHTSAPRGFYEIAYLEHYEPLVIDLLAYSHAMGIRITHADAEDCSQLEVNLHPGTPLSYVDDFFTYRQICRIVAKKHGLIASFMPKPFMGTSANGHHHNLSLISDSGEDLFTGTLKQECGLSEIATHFIGGLLEHSDAMTIIGAPTANSYKRYWDVGYWAPFHKSYGFNNRSCLFRVHSGRVEARQMDSSCNPYLTIAACLTAGMDGIKRRLDPGEPNQDNQMLDIRIPREQRIPLTIHEAVEAFEADPLMLEALPHPLYECFLEMRKDDRDRSLAHVSQWELDFYLERWP